MNQYEVMYIIDTAIDEQARTALINRFSGLVEANGGQVDRVDEELQLRQLEVPLAEKIAEVFGLHRLDIHAEQAQQLNVVVDALALGADAVGVQMGDQLLHLSGFHLSLDGVADAISFTLHFLNHGFVFVQQFNLGKQFDFRHFGNLLCDVVCCLSMLS